MAILKIFWRVPPSVLWEPVHSYFTQWGRWRTGGVYQPVQENLQFSYIYSNIHKDARRNGGGQPPYIFLSGADGLLMAIFSQSRKTCSAHKFGVTYKYMCV